MKYAKIVEWDYEDDCYVGSIPALAGPCAFGDDQLAVFKELCEIEEHCLSAGVPVPPPDSHPPLCEIITRQCTKFNLDAYRHEQAKAQPQTETGLATISR